MNAASRKCEAKDRAVVISLLTVAYLIGVAGFVVELDLIAKGFDYFGEFGMFLVLFIILNGAMLGACWWLGRQYDSL
jgi:hypothetical protein